MKLGSAGASNDPFPPLGSGKVDDFPTMGVTEKDSLLPLVWKDGSIVLVKLPCVIVVRKLIFFVKLCVAVCVSNPLPEPSVVAMVTCIAELGLSSRFDTNVFEPRKVDSLNTDFKE